MENIIPYEEETMEELAFPDANNNEDYENSLKEDKYSLRPRSVRRVTQLLQKNSENRGEDTRKSKEPKSKQKAAPLSKYRRKTANARERNRMREINQAFETLRRVIPQMATHNTATNEKLTKITTLRLAMKYISTLSAVLSGNCDQNLIFNEQISDCSEFDCFLLESDGESLSLSEHSLLASPDFSDSLSPVDFGDPVLPPFLQNTTDFGDQNLDPVKDFSDFLLT